MGMRPGWGWVAALAVAGLVGVGCGLGRHTVDDPAPKYSAAQLGDLSEQGSILDALEPEERAAVARVGLADPPPPDGAPADREGKADTAGKVGVSVLTVALSLAAAAAPFFLF